MSLDLYRGTILGLAVGDALGAPVEFLSLGQIQQRYGADGITDLESWGGFPAGCYTDDTQMSLATASGLIAARERFGDRELEHIPAVVHSEYLKWLVTQDDPKQRRAPGNTCLGSLKSGAGGTIDNPINHSKGCGGVMRMAPVGLAMPLKHAFHVGAECAALTHGHPSGYLTAGYLSELIGRLTRGEDLRPATEAVRDRLIVYDGHEETSERVNLALELSGSDKVTLDVIEQLGQGWVGEEALAIALYCALVFADDWARAVRASVNHSGDSDSTGSICGAILGAALGIEAIPTAWVEQVENRTLLEEVAARLYADFGGES